ncbi:hypothetical protein FB45DRAFT_931724 [Roridomyces roridus]|uniref:Cell wall protein n=1 Tax=Roridomyces roridus TaxID=1738132 RepID=A0AAD7BEI5_9AGAR|nr:hypothetical protein FB45DRAFT_931724 [Roridomyces roridus]
MARMLSVFFALFVALSAVAVPVERRQTGNLECNINRAQIVVALAQTGSAVKAINGTDAATEAQKTAAQTGLTSSGEGIAQIAVALVAGQAAPAAARLQTQQGLLDAQAALGNITDPTVADAVSAAQSKLATAITAGNNVVANCK